MPFAFPTNASDLAMEYLILTEATLPRLLARAALGRSTCVVSTFSLFRGSEPSYLTRIVSWLECKGRVHDLLSVRPDLWAYRNYGDFIRLTNCFAELEPWMEAYLSFSDAESRFGVYGRAYRHLCCNRIFPLYVTIHLLREICRTEKLGTFCITGLDRLHRAAYHARFGEDIPGRVRNRLRIDPAVNLLIAFASLVVTVGWILRHMRVAPAAAEEVLLGSDYAGSAHDTHLWREISDDPRQVVVVFRNAQMAQKYASLARDRRTCVATEGVFGITAGLAAMIQASRDILFLVRRGITLPGDFFRKLSVLPYRCQTFRALYNRFRFRFFWSRDDYNTEHILRTHELRKIGATSLGVMHGIPSVCSVVHQIRHIDFDIYYVHGRYQVEKYYRSRWPTHMQVKAIGSLGLSREEVHRLAETPPPPHVACFLSPTLQADQTFSALDKIARTFPDRTFYVNTKVKELDAPVYGRKLRRFLQRSPENVVYHAERSYELFFRCGTVLSEASTLAAEAIQYGRPSYIFDFRPDLWKVMDYRSFPAICVGSADEVIERIRNAESGAWIYPREAFASFIEMGGRIPWDVIREDMGLPAKESVLANLPPVEEGSKGTSALSRRAES